MWRQSLVKVRYSITSSLFAKKIINLNKSVFIKLIAYLIIPLVYVLSQAGNCYQYQTLLLSTWHKQQQNKVMHQRPLCAQSMATPYLFWPYMPISPMTSSPEVPVFHSQFPQNGNGPSEIIAPFLSPQLYANNVVLQNYRQQRQHQQHSTKCTDNSQIQNISSNRQEQDHNINNINNSSCYMKVELNPHLPVNTDVKINPLGSPLRRRRLLTPSKIRSSPISAKKGLFTIDAILNKSDDEDEKAQEEKSTSPLASPVPKHHRQESADSTPSEKWLSSPSDISSPKITLDASRLTTTPHGANTRVIPALHSSTPINYHAADVMVPHGHRPRTYVEINSHPYLTPKPVDVFSPHLYSSYQHHHNHHHHHHQSLLSQMSPQSSMSRSAFGSPSLNSSVSMSTSSSSPNSSSSMSSMSLSSSSSSTSSHNDKTDGKASNKNKRVRTIFTPEQLERLEAEFERQQYMVGTERFYLASSLNLTEAQVKVWFQNRRIKWRKQHLEQQQARLAQGDLYRDVEESGESDLEDDVIEPAMAATSHDDAYSNESSIRSDVD